MPQGIRPRAAVCPLSLSAVWPPKKKQGRRFAFPIITGRVLDHFEKLGKPTAGYSILFTFCGLAYVVAFALNHLLAPRFEQVYVPEIEQLEAGPEPNA